MIICQVLHQVLRMNMISSLLSSDSESHKGTQVQSSVMRMHAQSLSRVWFFCDPMDPSSSVLINFQARILEQVAISYFRGSFWLRDQTHVSCAGCWDTIPKVHVYAVWSIWGKSQFYVEVIVEIQLMSWCKARGKSGMKRAFNHSVKPVQRPWGRRVHAWNQQAGQCGWSTEKENEEQLRWGWRCRWEPCWECSSKIRGGAYREGKVASKEGRG